MSTLVDSSTPYLWHPDFDSSTPHYRHPKIFDTQYFLTPQNFRHRIFFDTPIFRQHFSTLIFRHHFSTPNFSTPRCSKYQLIENFSNLINCFCSQIFNSEQFARFHGTEVSSFFLGWGVEKLGCRKIGVSQSRNWRVEKWCRKIRCRNLGVEKFKVSKNLGCRNRGVENGVSKCRKV